MDGVPDYAGEILHPLRRGGDGVDLAPYVGVTSKDVVEEPEDSAPEGGELVGHRNGLPWSHVERPQPHLVAVGQIPQAVVVFAVVADGRMEPRQDDRVVDEHAVVREVAGRSVRMRQHQAFRALHVLVDHLRFLDVRERTERADVAGAEMPKPVLEAIRKGAAHERSHVDRVPEGRLPAEFNGSAQPTVVGTVPLDDRHAGQLSVAAPEHRRLDAALGGGGLFDYLVFAFKRLDVGIFRHREVDSLDCLGDRRPVCGTDSADSSRGVVYRHAGRAAVDFKAERCQRHAGSKQTGNHHSVDHAHLHLHHYAPTRAGVLNDRSFPSARTPPSAPCPVRDDRRSGCRTSRSHGTSRVRAEPAPSSFAPRAGSYVNGRG